MLSYGNRSIRQKLQGIVIVTCGAALVIATAVFTIYDRQTFLRAKTDDLVTAARMIGANSTAALAFRDANSGQEILSALQVKKHIVNACIYDSNGKIFAKYSREQTQPGFTPPPVQGEGTTVDARHIVLFHNIVLNKDSIGTIYLEADLTDLHDRLRRFILIDFIVLMTSLAIAFLLSYRLQRVISGPIRELATTASSVAAHENYSIRASKRSNDEIGVLFDQFNSMLDRIQQRDVALQKAHDGLEKRVEERTAYLNALIENSPLAIMVVDSEQKVQLCNPAFETLFQYTRQEVLGKAVDGLLAEGELLLEARAISLRARGDTPISLLTRRRRKDGSLVDVELHTVGLFVSAKLVGSMVIYQDISVRKRAEEAMQQAKEAAEAASRAKSEFLANMSHEIRTPMNGILGMTELVLDTELNSEQREYLNMAKMSADSLLTLINDILDFSKIEAGKLEIEAIDFNLGDCLDDTMKALSLRAHQKGLEIACDLSSEVPEELIGDPGRLRQVIMNLVGNAIKFTEKGEVIVSVQVDSRSGDDAQLHFTIADTGIGIPVEKQKAIFEAFTQADGSMSRTYGGTGLGLTICARLIELMHGRIWVESKPHKGSQFHFVAQFGLQKNPAKPILPEDPIVLQGMRILIVDDNATNRKILLRMLSNWGVFPTAVESGIEALAILKEGQELGTHPSLILLDAQMPNMDGFAVAELIKNHPVWKAVTIMMLSSAGHQGDAQRRRELGISASLTKPIRQADLLKAILLALGARPSKEEEPVPAVRESSAERRDHFRILLAEDNAVNQVLAVRLLEKRGHIVKVAGNGKEALAALQREQFDFVFMDVQMPVMDGFEATAEIRAQEKKSGNRLFIVAVTAHALVGDKERCLEAGMDDYITKPLRPQDLTDVLERYALAAMKEANYQKS